jgi:hypothetical protein
MHAALFATALLVTASLPARDQEPDECRHEAQRSATLNADGARLLSVGAGSGSLKITGKPGINQVIIRGRACASHADLLPSITLDANRRGNDIVVEANHRDRNNDWRDNEYARLDVTIEVPARMAAEIADGSGSIDISNLGAVRIDDGSGDIVGNDLHGDLRIEDGSGSIRLIDVAGRVNIDDGSGGISLRNIGGAIDIDDSSGEISVRVARSSVRISDSSGDIDVVDVDGDFTVVDDSSGSIDHDNVRGRVDVPRRRR